MGSGGSLNMLFRLPFSDPAGWSFRKAIIVGLVVLHSAWIVVHLNLVSRDLINPWKLSGYGMYTIPHPNPVLHVFDSRFAGFEIPSDTYKAYDIVSQNRFFIFRCQPITVASLQVFLNDNPKFVGVPLRFIVTELKLLRDPIRPEREPHSILEIRWTGQTTFDYAGKICGELYHGKAELKS